MTAFQHKPLPVTALQWQRTNLKDFKKLFPTLKPQRDSTMRDWLRVYTPSGYELLRPYDWLVQDARGKCRSFDPNTFAEIYEPASQPEKQP